MQAYLEAEPATRTSKDEYVMRYQRFAKHGLDKAILKYEGLHSSIGVITLIPSCLHHDLQHDVRAKQYVIHVCNTLTRHTCGDALTSKRPQA